MQFDESLPYKHIRSVGFNAHIGPIHFATVSDAEWRFYLDLDERHINIGGVCHGGVQMTLADVGMGAAAFRVFGEKGCATIEMDSHFMSAAKVGNRLHGVSRLLRSVRGLAFMEADLYSNERHCLRASGIWKQLGA